MKHRQVLKRFKSFRKRNLKVLRKQAASLRDEFLFWWTGHPQLHLPDDFKPYQDVWVRGHTLRAGARTCGRRYKFIYDAAAERYRPGFSVLDVGASEGYFSIRLAEDLNARCTLLEKKREIEAIVEAQKSNQLRCIRGRFDERSLARHGKFDLVIALSIVHHFPDWGAIFKRLCTAGDAIIVELPAENERGTKRSSNAGAMLNVLQWYNAEKLGETSGYASEATRELYALDFPSPPMGGHVVRAGVRGGRGSSTRQRRHYLHGAREQTGRKIVPGTLNLATSRPLYFKNGLVVESAKGPYHLFPCRFEGVPSYIVKPPRAKNIATTMEILSDLKLREVFSLRDKDEVLVEISPDHVATSSDEIAYNEGGVQWQEEASQQPEPVQDEEGAAQ